VRVLHLVAADRFTGAAAPALLLVEALRSAGCEAELAIRGGHNLQSRLTGCPWVHPILAKERSLWDLRRAVERVRQLAVRFDVLHCHLPHDHTLARLALRGLSGQRMLVRSVRHPRHLRRDPFHRFLFAGTHGVAFATEALAGLGRRWPSFTRRATVTLPPAVEKRFLRPGDGDGARARLEVPREAVVAGTVGKLHRSRGQDLFLRALAAAPGVWGLIVGQGEHEEELRRLAVALGVAPRVRFTGYVEEHLVDLYAAMDLFVFPAAGSDWGHRAVVEAQACGVPVLAADLAGVTELIEVGATGDVYPRHDAAALAVLLEEWARSEIRRVAGGRRAAARARPWAAATLASVALTLYGSARRLHPADTPAGHVYPPPGNAGVWGS
jgi:glycosyltransferase involved in cell wall biosynthesis